MDLVKAPAVAERATPMTGKPFQWFNSFTGSLSEIRVELNPVTCSSPPVAESEAAPFEATLHCTGSNPIQGPIGAD